MDALQLLVLWDKPSISKGHLRPSADITATLKGIYIQGARMTSAAGIDECHSDTPSWNLIPHCYLSWVPADGVVRFKFTIFIRQCVIYYTTHTMLFSELYSDQWTTYRESAALC